MRTDITAADKILWGAIDYRQRDKADCFPSLSTLAKDVGVNRDTAAEGIRRLENARLLTVVRAQGQPNHYTTHLPEIPSGVEEAATGPPPAGNPDPNNHVADGGDYGCGGNDGQGHGVQGTPDEGPADAQTSGHQE